MKGTFYLLFSPFSFGNIAVYTEDHIFPFEIDNGCIDIQEHFFAVFSELNGFEIHGGIDLEGFPDFSFSPSHIFGDLFQGHADEFVALEPVDFACPLVSIQDDFVFAPDYENGIMGILKNTAEVSPGFLKFIGPLADLPFQLCGVTFFGKRPVDIEKEGACFIIRLSSSVLSKNLFLELSDHDGYFSDNYFDIIPGEKCTIKFFPENDLSIEEFRKYLNISTLTDAAI